MQTETAPIALVTGVAARAQPDDLLTSAGLKAVLGNVSDMTLWRWTHQRGFPSPDLIIARRKFWRRATVQAWLAAQAAEGGVDAPAA